MNCLTCKAPTDHDFYLCLKCLDELHDVIESIPAIITELDVNIAKLSKRGKPGNSGGGGTSIHGAAPVDQTASDIKRDLKAAIITTSAAVARITRERPAAGSTMEQVCVWLSEKTDWLALNPTLAGLHPNLLKQYRRACATIDIPPDTMTVGVCGALAACGWPADTFADNDRWCTRELVVRPGQRTVMCRDCGTVWDVHRRRHDALQAAWLEPVRPGAIAAALRGWGMQVTLRAVETWIYRKMLHPVDDDGRYKRYRLIEAYNLAYRIQLRREARYSSKDLSIQKEML